MSGLLVNASSTALILAVMLDGSLLNAGSTVRFPRFFPAQSAT